jgi:hypothetical protein
MTEFNLNTLIERALTWKEPDPHVIARRLLPRIPAEERDAILASLLVERVTLLMRSQRSDNLAPGQTSSETQGERAGGKSRWERHAPRLRYPTADGWKFRGDLTAEDCDRLADNYEARAAANAAAGAEFRALAERLRAAGAQRVADLDAVQVAA